MRILVAILIFTAAFLWQAPPGHAGCPGFGPSYVELVQGGLYMTPAGNGLSLQASGLTLQVVAIDDCSGPIAGLPREDLWVDCVETDALQFCGGGNLADQDTDAEGRTRFTYALQGGGHSTMGLSVYIQGNPIGVGDSWSSNQVLEIRVNSPDINGDLVVDLSDIALFGQDLELGTGFRSDLTHDGVVNLSDIAEFTRAIGEHCP